MPFNDLHDCTTGEAKQTNIIKAMWETNYNLQQIIFDSKFQLSKLLYNFFKLKVNTFVKNNL